MAAIGALTAVTGAAHFFALPSLITFTLAAFALAGLAWIVSFSTEQVGERFGPAVTGVLQSSLGNLPELFVVIFALSAGDLVVAETSIIGSIFANALLMLGIVFIVGARASEDGVMRFHPRLPKDNAVLMILASFLIVLIGIAVAAHDKASHHIVAVSAVGATAILATYGFWLYDYLRASPGESEPSHGTPVVAMPVALGLLGVAGLGAALVSDWFVSALTPAMQAIHVPKAFAGLVIVAIAGNAVENFSGIVMARKGNFDLAVSVVKNSVAQITALLYPALVLISLLFTTHLTFALAPVFIGALLLTALALHQITSDGEATVFEGIALVALYVILATIVFFE